MHRRGVDRLPGGVALGRRIAVDEVAAGRYERYLAS